MKILFPLLLLVWLVTAAEPATAQQNLPKMNLPAPAADASPVACGTYSGQVAANGKLLPGVSIEVPGTSISLVTNEEGFFSFSSKGLTQPTVLVSAAGYTPQKLTYTSCTLLEVNMHQIEGTRIKKRGKKKGFIVNVKGTY